MWPGWVQGNSDGPLQLVTMVGLVPIENDVIPMVLLVNMHFIFSGGLATNGSIGTNRKEFHSNGAYSPIEPLE